MTKNEDLKACPFCGEQPLAGGINNEWIRCPKHQPYTGWINVTDWNTRPTPPDTAMEDAVTREDTAVKKEPVPSATSSTTDGDAERALEEVDAVVKFLFDNHGTVGFTDEGLETIRAALHSTRKTPVPVDTISIKIDSTKGKS